MAPTVPMIKYNASSVRMADLVKVQLLPGKVWNTKERFRGETTKLLQQTCPYRVTNTNEDELKLL